jgi:acetyl-CoA carboxylase biotin carboxyl carrier protein
MPGRPTQSRNLVLDLRYVKKLVEMLDESSLDSIEISTEKGLKIRVSKAAVQVPVVAAPAPMPVPAGVELRLSPAGGVPAQPEPTAPPPPAAPAANLVEVKSPMVGTFYAAPEPGAKPFVTVGSHVAKGQVLCIIEAMKIMNEIESEHAGVVKEIVATDGHPVEYGQTLFRIDPNG